MIFNFASHTVYMCRMFFIGNRGHILNNKIKKVEK